MQFKAVAAAAMLLLIGAPSLAQSGSMRPEPGSDMHTTRDDRGQQSEGMHSAPTHRGPTARQLNRREARYAMTRSRARADYRRDRRAYMAAVMRRQRLSVSRYRLRYARREMAYANAMAAWRRQVSACHRGDRHACNAPAPRVANYY